MNCAYSAIARLRGISVITFFSAAFAIPMASTTVAAADDMANARFPTRPITIVVSVPPGAGTDVIARTLGQRLGVALGQSVVVDNKAGASGMLAASQVAKSPPDGHMLLLAPNTLLIAPYVLAKSATSVINPTRDLTPIVKVASSPLVLTAHPSLGVKNIAEYLALARRTPGITYASSGVGSPFHIAGEVIQRETGVKLTHVPYKGLGQAATDAMSGQVQSLFATTGGVISEMISSGKIIPLAVAEKKRSQLLPNVPTLAESGIHNAEIGVWFALYAPAGTPPALINRLNKEVNDILHAADFRARLTSLGVDIAGSTVEEVKAEVGADSLRYGRLVSDFNIRE